MYNNHDSPLIYHLVVLEKKTRFILSDQRTEIQTFLYNM